MTYNNVAIYELFTFASYYLAIIVERLYTQQKGLYMKPLKMLFLSSMVILFTACGGGGGSTVLGETTEPVTTDTTTPDAAQWDSSNWDEAKWQ